MHGLPPPPLMHHGGGDVVADPHRGPGGQGGEHQGVEEAGQGGGEGGHPGESRHVHPVSELVRGGGLIIRGQGEILDHRGRPRSDP